MHDDGWGTITFTPDRPGARRDRMLTEYRVAAHAQALREEAYTGGHATERLAFYGNLDAPAVDDAEQRLTFRDWIVGMAEPVPDPTVVELLPCMAEDLDTFDRALEVSVCGRCGQAVGQYDRQHTLSGWVTEQGWNLCPAADDDYHAPLALVA